jgi:hypothetical protein
LCADKLDLEPRNDGMSRRRTKAQWNAMSRRKRYVFIAVAVLTALGFAFALLVVAKHWSYQGIVEYEGHAE